MAQRRQKASQKSRARSPQQTVASLRRSLTRERRQRREAIGQQQATAEILKVISESPTDIRPVFQAIAERAARLCEAGDAQVFVVNGEKLELVAHSGKVAQAAPSQKIERGWATGRAVMERAPVQVKDVLALPREFPTSQITSKLQGVRTVLALPLMLKGVAVGAITLRRREVRPFSDKQIALLKTFADQAVIAIENVRLFNETKEALEQQTATADILNVISATTTDTQPVFEAIARSALHIFGGMDVSVGLVEGNAIRICAGTISSAGRGTDPLIPLDRDSYAGAVYLDRTEFNIADIEAPGTPRLSRERGRLAGWRSIAIVPMLREGVAIGHISLHRNQPVALDDKQFALLRTFARQAVIAIENVRLFNETKEALERQTATADILRAISESPTDIQPVLHAVVERAAQLCDASNVHVRLVQGELMPVVVHIGAISMPAQARTQPISRTSIAGRAILDCRTMHVEDVTDPKIGEQYPDSEFLRHRGEFRSLLVVPMVREGKAIGTISVRRAQVGSFSEQHIKLLQTFAAQAVIAIENVRLFNETKDALEQQTATSEILRVISSSPSDLQPVFDTIVRNFMALCGATFGSRVHVRRGACALRRRTGLYTRARAGASRPSTPFAWTTRRWSRQERSWPVRRSTSTIR